MVSVGFQSKSRVFSNPFGCLGVSCRGGDVSRVVSLRDVCESWLWRATTLHRKGIIAFQMIDSVIKCNLYIFINWLSVRAAKFLHWLRNFKLLSLELLQHVSWFLLNNRRKIEAVNWLCCIMMNLIKIPVECITSLWLSLVLSTLGILAQDVPLRCFA